MENFQKKAPSLCWQRDQISEAVCRQVNMETEQFKIFEKSQLREFWDSQQQCPYQSLPTHLVVERKRDGRE
jgi:hypothetical protein